jgi:hypothetical protein
MIQTGCKFFDLLGFTVRTNTAKDKYGSSTRVGEEKIAIRCGTDEARHCERAAAESHHLLVVGTLHRSSVAPGVKGHFEAGGRERPCIGRFRNDVRSVVDGLFRLGFRQVSERDLAADTGLLLVPIGECGLTCNGLLRRYCRGNKRGG